MAAASLLVAVLLPSVVAGASPSDPSQWPAGHGADPELTATPNTIRLSGADRYQTNLALSLALRGAGGFPFDTSDPTSGNATALARANGWWGAASCPRSIVVVSGDTFADALVAASLSDPTDRSAQPRLERVAAADPLFDPVGGYDRVDTAYAPIVVTNSARNGAKTLAQTARLTASDFAKGGCTTARNAIIVGGPDAVPTGVESELVSLGYDEVFRVAGTNRYDTAARVATALGTQAPTATTCLDDDVTDGSARVGWYGNAAVEFRSDATHCRLLSRSVVLADGGTGADALAAGWWTSRWQVPVLLVAPDGSLPPATRTALQTLDVDTVIVLGGTARIPESSANEAKALALAVVGRISGPDRYATSVSMAQKFGGWWPTGDGTDFADDLLCATASSGTGSAAVGWADALAAGPWCARLGVSGVGSPQRALPPVSGSAAATTVVGGRHPSHDAVPIILVPAGGTVPEATSSFLTGTFDRSAPWCTSASAVAGCVGPGFLTVFGGTRSVTSEAQAALDGLVSGATSATHEDGPPGATAGFATRLDLSPIFTTVGVPGQPVACYASGAINAARWLSVTSDADRRMFVVEADILRAARYGPDGRSLPTCVSVGRQPTALVSPVSVDGQVGGGLNLDLSPSEALSLTGDVGQDGTTNETGSRTEWAFAGPLSAPVQLQRGDTRRPVTAATLDLTLHLSSLTASYGTVDGTVSMTTDVGRVSGPIVAEAVRAGGRWAIRGSAELGSFASGSTRGGFRIDVVDGASPHARWMLDGAPFRA